MTLIAGHINWTDTDQNLATTGTVTASQLISTVAIGTAPLTVTSTTAVSNLNADKADGYDFNQDVRTTGTPTFGATTLNGNLICGTRGTYTLGASGSEFGALWIGDTDGDPRLQIDCMGQANPLYASSTHIHNFGSDEIECGKVDCDAVEIDSATISSTSGALTLSSATGTVALGANHLSCANVTCANIDASGTVDMAGGTSSAAFLINNGIKLQFYKAGNSAAGGELFTYDWGAGVEDFYIDSEAGMGLHLRANGGSERIQIEGATGTYIGDGGSTSTWTNYVQIDTGGDLDFHGSAGFYPRFVEQAAEPANGTGATQIDDCEMIVWRDTDDDKIYLMFNDNDNATKKIVKVELT